MLSRRNVRIKVMQVLYSANRDSALTNGKAEVAYKYRVKTSYKTYLFNLLFLQKIASYATNDEATRKAKLRPSEEDKNFQAIFATNPITENLASHKAFYQQLQSHKLLSAVRQDMVRQIYFDFAKLDEYKVYTKKESYTNKDHRDILLGLFKFCIKHEVFNDCVEDVFPNWVDDESLVVGAVKKTIKSFPDSYNFYEEFIPDKETVDDYGLELLYKISRLDEDLLEIIKPQLQNWEAERVAILDMIMLKMAICEFLHFPTIPTKVTINEYIDISKMYSTPKSKDFINGILDRLLKKMKNEGLIEKSGRGLIN